MKTKKLLITVISIIVLSFAFKTATLADFGNFDTYDDSTWDSGSWDTSSGWDSDTGFGGDYYSDYGDYDYDSDSDGDLETLIAVIVIILIIVFVFYKKGGNIRSGNTGRNYQPKYNPIGYQNKNAEISTVIRATDAAFNSEKFIAFANEAYVKLQNAWSERDIEPVRLLLSEELFAQTLSQVQEYRRIGKINRMERIAVQESYITDYSSDNEKEALSVYLYATQKDYIVDENTGNVLEGSDKQYRHSKYILTFIRAKGTLTADNEGIKDTNCPNCGAPLELCASGKCPYCDSVITNEDHSWVISAIKRVN